MQENQELAGMVPEGVPEAIAALGFAVEEVRRDGDDGSLMAFLVDEESSLAHAEVVMVTWDGGASFRYLDSDDYDDTVALGYTDADYDRFVQEMHEKVERLRSEVGARYFGAAV